MMLLTDGVSSYRKAYFLANKSAEMMFQAFRDFHIEAECQTGKKLLKVHLDGGGEWYNNIWDDYLKEHGIVSEITVAYAHAQNRVPKHGMRLVFEGVRSMLADSGLPPSLWAEAASTTVYLHNFIPSSRHPDKVPVEVWTGKRQDVSHVRPFSCDAFAKIPVEIRVSKLDPRSIKYSCIFYIRKNPHFWLWLISHNQP